VSTTGRDYRKARAPREGGIFSGASGLVIGLTLGGLGAFFAYQRGHDAGMASVRQAQPTKPASQRATEAAEAATNAPPVETIDYTFYDRLKHQNVEIPEEAGSASTVIPAPVKQPGMYQIQVGSFPQKDVGERMRATLALQGIESTLQPVLVDGRTWHRVIIGPVSNPKDVSRVRDKLLRMGLAPPVINRVGD
jgi:cell division protein FtsN